MNKYPVPYSHRYIWNGVVRAIINKHATHNVLFDVFSTVHHSIELFHQPTWMHNFLYSVTICLLHYYPRHVSSINMPIFRRKNCIHRASGIFALCKRLHSTLVERGLQSALNQSIIYILNHQQTRVIIGRWQDNTANPQGSQNSATALKKTITNHIYIWYYKHKYGIKVIFLFLKHFELAKHSFRLQI